MIILNKNLKVCSESTHKKKIFEVLFGAHSLVKISRKIGLKINLVDYLLYTLMVIFELRTLFVENLYKTGMYALSYTKKRNILLIQPINSKFCIRVYNK